MVQLERTNSHLVQLPSLLEAALFPLRIKLLKFQFWISLHQ